MAHKKRLTPIWLAAVSVLLGASLVTAGCVRSPEPVKPAATPQKPGVTPEEQWDRDALAAAQPCLLALRDGPDASLTAVDLAGRVVADNVWLPPAATSTLLLDAEPHGPRVALSVDSASSDAPADVRDRLFVLDKDGAVRTASEPTTAFPLVSSAVFLDTGDLLWLRRRETQSSIDTTMGVTDIRRGTVTPVVLDGSWPSYRFVAGLTPLGGASAVAVVLKTDGTPGPRDDFAVVMADYQNGRLISRSSAYRDDSLFTLGSGPRPGTLVYARAKDEESSRADELIELVLSGDTWTPRILLRNAGCDPGFDYQHVCGAGPNGSVLYRSAIDPQTDSGSAILRMLPSGSTDPRDTGVVVSTVGNQWLWLGEPSR